jgi:hypothetical protein
LLEVLKRHCVGKTGGSPHGYEAEVRERRTQDDDAQEHDTQNDESGERARTRREEIDGGARPQDCRSQVLGAQARWAEDRGPQVDSPQVDSAQIHCAESAGAQKLGSQVNCSQVNGAQGPCSQIGNDRARQEHGAHASGEPPQARHQRSGDREQPRAIVEPHGLA